MYGVRNVRRSTRVHSSPDPTNQRPYHARPRTTSTRPGPEIVRHGSPGAIGTALRSGRGTFGGVDCRRRADRTRTRGADRRCGCPGVASRGVMHIERFRRARYRVMHLDGITPDSRGARLPANAGLARCQRGVARCQRGVARCQSRGCSVPTRGCSVPIAGLARRNRGACSVPSRDCPAACRNRGGQQASGGRS